MDKTKKFFTKKAVLFLLILFFGLWVFIEYQNRSSEPSVVQLEEEMLELSSLKDTLTNSKFLLKFAAKYGLPSYVRGLPLDKEVEERVIETLKSEELGQLIIPFLLMLKDKYVLPASESKYYFNNYIRPIFPENSVPGLNHTLFTYDLSKDTKSSEGIEMDKQTIADLVTAFDLTFLKPKTSVLKEVTNPSKTTVEKLVDILKKIIKRVADNMDEHAEAKETAHAILKNNELITNAARTVIYFLRSETEKAFARSTSIERSQSQLESFLLAQLTRPHAGYLWKYIEREQNKKYIVHIIVDGLQGHLLEALAKGDPNSEFIKKIYEDHISFESSRPGSKNTRLAPNDLKHEFLEYFAKNGYDNPRYLPYFKNLYKNQPYGIAVSGTSTTPTISVRNLPLVKTGAPVTSLNPEQHGATGIPNFHFVDRTSSVKHGYNKNPKMKKLEKEQGRAYYFFGNDAALMAEISKGFGMKTLFERLGQAGIISLNCNGQYDFGASEILHGFFNLGLGEKIRDFGDILCYYNLKNRLANELKIREIQNKILNYKACFNLKKRTENPNKSLFESLKSFFGEEMYRQNCNESLPVYTEILKKHISELASLKGFGLPEYLQYYNPWPDHFAHFKGPFSDEVIAPNGELNRLDYWLSKIESIYNEAGLLDRTLFGMAGDHGMTPARFFVNPEIEVFGTLKEEGIEFIFEKISADEGGAPRFTNPTNPPSMKGKDVVIASTAGGNYMMDFFVDQNENWSRQPLYHELTSYNTLAGKTVDIPSEILKRLPDTLEYMTIRKEECDPSKSSTLLLAPRAGERVEELVLRKGEKVYYKNSKHDLLQIRVKSPYREWSSNDQLKYETLFSECVTQAKENNIKTWCNEDQWNLLSSYTIKPGSVTQISHLFDTDLAGTINLFPIQNVGYNSSVPGRHAGEHFHEKDAFVGFWGRPIKNNKNRIQTAFNGSISPTLYQYITQCGIDPVKDCDVQKGKDGFGFHSHWKRLSDPNWKPESPASH